MSGAPETEDAVVTGAAGFAGSHVVEALLQRGARVVAIDRRSPRENPEAARNLSKAIGAPCVQAG